MKKIFILIGIIIIALNIKAQTNYLPTGTWKYINGTDTIEIYLKSAQLMAGGVSYPVLIGFHKYIKNGQVIESNLNFSTTGIDDKKYSIIMYGNDISSVRYDGNFKDLTLSVNRLIILTKLSTTTMNVRLTSKQTRKNINGIGYTLPRNFQLTK